MNTFKEPEIAIAAFLHCRGLRLIGTTANPQRPQQKLFIFEDPQTKAALEVIEYVNNVQIGARDYSSAMTFLKDMVYSAARGTEYMGKR